MLYGIGDPPLRLDGAGGPRGLSMVSPGFLRMRGAAASGSAAMRDRTRELHQGSDSDSEGEGPGGEGRLLGPQDPALAQARRVRSLLAALSRSAAELEQLQERALGTPLPPPELQEELQRLRDEIQDLTREIQGGLRALAPAPEEAPNSIGARLRRTQAPSPLSARALDEAGQRHRELQRLERGLRELGELFQLLSGTVEAQGDVIDRIEQQVLHSGAHLEKGRGHLQGAGRRQKAARKKRLALAACASVAILVLVAIVAASVASG
ncbi:syntaxin-4-like isoform X1 [Zonotrichia albicollis]|uniref:syntaxin-4-like isoform X1 n=1 Tax=Zonotrichia albicollis TaxID=44394 RepID=UPI003D811084